LFYEENYTNRTCYTYSKKLSKLMRKFIKETPALVSIIVLPTILWTIIASIEYTIGYFLPIQFVGPLAGLSGVAIGVYVSHVKNS
jgi:hypothetical protein